MPCCASIMVLVWIRRITKRGAIMPTVDRFLMRKSRASACARAWRGIATVTTLGVAAVLTGCANPPALSATATYGQTPREQIVRLGTVQAVRPLVIQNDGIHDTIPGSRFDGTVELGVGKTDGLEITVQLDNGETRVVAQAADVSITSGQRVRMISGGGTTRIVPM